MLAVALVPVFGACHTHSARNATHATTTSSVAGSAVGSPCTGSVTAGPVTAAVRSDTPASLTVHVGDTITIAASGVCARDVSGSPQSEILAVVSPTEFRATAPGTTSILVTYPSCEGESTTTGAAPGCVGGEAQLGSVNITVTRR